MLHQHKAICSHLKISQSTADRSALTYLTSRSRKRIGTVSARIVFDHREDRYSQCHDYVGSQGGIGTVSARIMLDHREGSTQSVPGLCQITGRDRHSQCQEYVGSQGGIGTVSARIVSDHREGSAQSVPGFCRITEGSAQSVPGFCRITGRDRHSQCQDYVGSQGGIGTVSARIVLDHREGVTQSVPGMC